MKREINKLDLIIGKKIRNKFFILMILIFIGMSFEVIGLSSLLPVLSIITNPESLKSISLINNLILEYNLSYNYIVYYSLIFLVSIYFIKTFFLSYLTFRQNRFLANVIAEISNNLFKSYINQPYIFHINKNSTNLIKNLTVEVNLLNSFNSAIISIFVEFGIVFSILLTLVFIEPFGALTVGIFLGLISSLFFKYSKRILISLGIERENLDENLFKTYTEGISGIRELKILNVEEFFIKIVTNENLLKSKITSKANTLGQIPRYFLEFISVVGIFLFIVIMLLQDKEIPLLIATIGVFVAAVFRIMPSLNKILTSFQQIKYYSSSVDIIFNELKNLSYQNNTLEGISKLSLKDKIVIDDLIFNYDSDNKILDKISLEIHKGEFIGIIGESGSGKTSLVNLINGLFTPVSGKILVDGEDIYNNLSGWKKTIGYVPQDIYLLDDTIEQNVAFGIESKNIDKEKVYDALKLAEINSFVSKLKKGIKTKVGERGVQISGGQRQRLGLARALYKNPDFLILDEATSALDNKTELSIMNSINKLKGEKTIILIAHRQSTLSSCDKIFEIKNNKLKEVKI